MCVESYLRGVSFAAVIALCSVEDLRSRRIPDPVVGSGFIAALLLSPSLRDTLGGSAIGLALFLAIRGLCRGRLGLGDVKLAGYLGSILGIRLLWVAIALASLSALAAMAVRARSGRAALDASLPFAPFLSTAALLSPLIDRVAPSRIVELLG